MTENDALEQKAPMKFTSSLCILKTEHILNYFRIRHIFLVRADPKLWGEWGSCRKKRKIAACKCVSFMQT